MALLGLLLLFSLFRWLFSFLKLVALLEVGSFYSLDFLVLKMSLLPEGGSFQLGAFFQPWKLRLFDSLKLPQEKALRQF